MGHLGGQVSCHQKPLGNREAGQCHPGGAGATEGLRETAWHNHGRAEKRGGPGLRREGASSRVSGRFACESRFGGRTGGLVGDKRGGMGKDMKGVSPQSLLFLTSPPLPGSFPCPKKKPGDFLVVQWPPADSLLAMQGAWVQSLVRELDPTCCN